MNNYRLIAVLSGKATPAKKKTFTEKLKKIVDVNKGNISSTEDWGEIQLEYKIKGNTSGNFLEFKLKLKPDSVKTINDKLRVEEGVIRFLLTKEDK